MSAFKGKEDSYYTYSAAVGTNNVPSGAWSGGLAGLKSGEGGTLLSYYYNQKDPNMIEIPLPAPVKGIKSDGSETVKQPSPRKATQSIFNRYSLFYFNSLTLGPDPEPYLDKPKRLDGLFKALEWTAPQGGSGGATASGSASAGNGDNMPKKEASGEKYTPGIGGSSVQNILRNPTAKNIIQWCQSQGVGDPRIGTNAVEYAWEDFLWCKNYGIVPNNYMVTLRRFPQPVNDDIWDPMKMPVPDISRMITWVDGEANTWESVGLKFSAKINWKEFESEIQTISGGGGGGGGGGMGNEGAALAAGGWGSLGNAIKSVSWLTQKAPGSPPSAFKDSGGGGGGGGGADPYANKNVVYGPLDVIKKMWMREKGLEHTQEITLKFEYELRSIDGINPKVAMIDLLSNVFVMTTQRGEFWGGDVRFFGGGGGGGGDDAKTVGPLGDPKKLLAGDYSGYFKSLTDGIKSRIDEFTGGQGLTLEGITTAAKGLAGNLMSNIVGGAFDDSAGGGGGAGAQSINSLLTGEDTGEWHVMVGNPANPIMSIGNLICENSEYHLHGPLGNDDFPSKLTVTIKLKPARHRDRSDLMAMFHRGGRTYTTISPSGEKFTPQTKPKEGNKPTPNKGKTSTNKTDSQAKSSQPIAKEEQVDLVTILKPRFTNHSSIDALLTSAAQGIY
jgi:hypothetical protein